MNAYLYTRIVLMDRSDVSFYDVAWPHGPPSENQEQRVTVDRESQQTSRITWSKD